MSFKYVSNLTITPSDIESTAIIQFGDLKELDLVLNQFEEHCKGVKHDVDVDVELQQNSVSRIYN